MIGVSAILFIAISKKHRFWFKCKEPYFASLIALIIFLPVIIWNFQNDFASFSFQLKHGLGSGIIPIPSLSLFFKCFGAQAAYISPPIFIVFIASAYFCIKEILVSENYEIKEKNLLILCFSMPILILFNTVSLFNEILPHWPAMGYLTLSIYVAHLIMRFWNKKWFRNYIRVSFLFTFIIIFVVVLHLLYKIVPIYKFMPSKQADKVEYGIPNYEQIDISNDLFGYEQIGEEIKKIINSYDVNKRPFIFTHKSYLASQLAFAIPEFRVFCIGNKLSAYKFWQNNIYELKNKNALFVSSDYFYFDPRNYKTAFSSYSETLEIPVYRNGKKVKNFFITICYGFNPDNLPKEYKYDL
jgi:hypothetical protein